MKMILFQMILIFMIIFLLISLLNIISKKMILDREKNSPFECGFDPKNYARLPFSLQFFLIILIFVIFDVELTLLLPIIFIMKISDIPNMVLTLFFFTMLLLLGLLHENKQGSLNWVK